jgi:hypothetical protein
MPKLKLLIFDAGVVFELHELGLWAAVLDQCEIHLSRIVADIEVRYYAGKEYDEVIDLSPFINSGQLRIFGVDVSDVQKFRERFDRNYMSKLDDGEAESLTYMLVSQPGEWRISSSDAIVFRVLGNLNEGEKGISLEELLAQIGRTHKDLKSQFKKEFRDKYTREGQIERVRGLGLRGPL